MGMPYVPDLPAQRLAVNDLIDAGFRLHGITQRDSEDRDPVLFSGGLFAVVHFDGSVSTYRADGRLIRGARHIAGSGDFVHAKFRMTPAQLAEWDGE